MIKAEKLPPHLPKGKKNERKKNNNNNERKKKGWGWVR